MAEFEESCPYFRPSSLDRSSRIHRPMFRLQELFSDRSVYTGDSFGDRSYIDTSMTRACSMQCRCRFLASKSFAFEVRKTASGINVRLRSFMLYLYFAHLLGPKAKPQDAFGKDIDGFHLLKMIDVLESQLWELRAEMHRNSLSNSVLRTLGLSRENSAQFEAELSLLVEGLVADDQVFESFGYENLYEKGFLTYDRWKSFQSSKTSRTLDQLDWVTHSIDQFEDDEDFNHSPKTFTAPLDEDAWGHFAEHEYFWSTVRQDIGQDSLLRQGSRRPNIPTVREDSLNTIKIRWLHREFRKQHTHIVKCARASTNLGWPPPGKGAHCPAWGDTFDQKYSQAWSRGIAVMRDLCRGEAPSTLYDTIMFLAMGKAICLSKIASSLSDHHAEFLADLGRWQVLFGSDEWSLSAFRNAVSDIWQVSAEELGRVQPPYATSLIHFQELAMSLITDVEQCFDRQRDLDKGLLASQEPWGWNRVQEMSETQRPEPFDMQFPENIVERGKFTESDLPISTASGKTDASQSPEPQIPLTDAIHNDSRLRICNTIVVLLMASFVFSIVLVFLKELQYRLLLPTLATSEILHGAVFRLCVTLENEFALNVLERVKSTLNNAIQQGYIINFSDLTRFIYEHDFAQTSSEPSVAINIRHSLLAAWSIWKPSYDLQQRYHILQTYLGLKKYESIVPHAVQVKTPPEEPHNVHDSLPRLNSQAPSITFSSPHSQSPESNSSAVTAAYTNDVEMETQLLSGHDISQTSYGNLQPMLDSTPPPHQQPPVQHTVGPSDQPRAKTYCEECNHDFKIVGNYNKHRKDKHERVRFACRHPPCRMTYSRKHYRDIHENERHATGPT